MKTLSSVDLHSSTVAWLWRPVNLDGLGTLSAEQVLKGLTRQIRVTLQDIARKIADVDESGGAASEKRGLGTSFARRVTEAFCLCQNSMEAVKPLCQIPKSQQSTLIGGLLTGHYTPYAV